MTRWKQISTRELENDEKQEHNPTNYILTYKEWGHVINHKIPFNNPSSLRRRICKLDNDEVNYSYAIYREVIE